MVVLIKTSGLDDSMTSALCSVLLCISSGTTMPVVLVSLSSFGIGLIRM